MLPGAKDGDLLRSKSLFTTEFICQALSTRVLYEPSVSYNETVCKILIRFVIALPADVGAICSLKCSRDIRCPVPKIGPHLPMS